MNHDVGSMSLSTTDTDTHLLGYSVQESPACREMPYARNDYRAENVSTPQDEYTTDHGPFASECQPHCRVDPVLHCNMLRTSRARSFKSERRRGLRLGATRHDTTSNDIIQNERTSLTPDADEEARATAVEAWRQLIQHLRAAYII